MNILVFAKNWLGDVLFEIPAIHALKRHFPQACLIVAAPPRCVDILKADPNIDEVIAFDERGQDKSVSAKWRFVRLLRSKHIDKAYLFHRSGTRACLTWLGGAKERIGYDTKGRGFFLTHRIKEPERNGMHDVSYFLELARASGVPAGDDAYYEFFFRDHDLRFIRQELSKNGIDETRLIAINPGANWLPKRWPAEHFGYLAKCLIECSGVQVIITGSEADEPLAKTIQETAKGLPVFSFCGKTTLSELGALFSLCKLVISNDSGPLHIASGVGAPVLAIFGPTDPKRTGPMGKGRNVVIHHVPQGQKVPWYGKEFPYGAWLEQLGPDEVFHTIQKERLLA